MLGNILLILTAIVSVGFFSISASPMPGGDRGVGHALAFVVCGAGLLLSSGLLVWNLAANHRLDWLTTNNWLIFLGWATIVFAIVMCANFKTGREPGTFPEFLRWLAVAKAHFGLVLLMLASAFWLINFQNAEGVAPNFVQKPMKTGLIVSILNSLGMLFGLLRGSAKQAAARQEYYKNQNDEQHNKHLTWIAQQKPTDPIVNILALTGRYHDTDVRDSAIAKVKSHPDWEAKMIELLSETEWDTEVYTFIDGNTVDHPELFVEPIKISLRRVAGAIKKRIKNANDLHPLEFEHFSLERCLRAIDDQFSKVPGADFRSEVQAIRTALDTRKPEGFEKVKLSLTPVVDAWLKAHR